MKMTLYKSSTLLIIFMTIVYFSGGEKVGVCNTCMKSNSVACMDETHFITCHNGQLTSTITPCPGNSVCTADLLICRLPEEGFTPICYEENCNNCKDSNGIFTCLDQTTYGYCFGSSTPYVDATRSCPAGYVCNIHSPEICVPAETNKPSCLTITTTPSPTEPNETDSTTVSATTPTPPWSSTTGAPKDADAYCKEIGKNGYFKSDDPTCREYIYCYLLSGQYLGWFYYCDGYYNIETMKCQQERPSDCQEQ